MLGISSGILIALIIIILFFLVCAILQKLGVLERFGFEFGIPLLIWQTQRGRSFIDKVAKKRKKFWRYYGNLGLVVAAIAMVIIMAMIIWSAMLASHVPSDQAPTLDMVLVIPGVNPVLPLWYGIAALVIAIVVHEFSHGILARLADVKIKSMGVVFLVVPLGAFVEPDEEEMKSLSRTKRSRIYGAGPTTNIILAIVLVLIFSTVFMGSISAKEDGVIINQISPGSSLYDLDIEGGQQIISVGGIDIDGIDDFRSLEINPAEDVEITVFDGSNKMYYQVKSGLVVTGVEDGYPAGEAGLESGDIIYSMEETVIKNHEDFFDYMDDTSADQTVHVTFYREIDDEYERNHTNMTLVDKYEAYEEMFPTENREEFKGAGYAGISVNYLGINVWDSDFLPTMLATPFEGAETFNEYVQAGMSYIALPFLGLSPVPENVANLYEINGPMSILPTSSFWITANLIYFVFWLNLLVGLFNALPAVPLDGGHMFKDGLSGFMDIFGTKDKYKEKIIKGVSYTMGFAILFMLIWQLVGPRV